MSEKSRFLKLIEGILEDETTRRIGTIVIHKEKNKIQIIHHEQVIYVAFCGTGQCKEIFYEPIETIIDLLQKALNASPVEIELPLIPQETLEAIKRKSDLHKEITNYLHNLAKIIFPLTRVIEINLEHHPTLSTITIDSITVRITPRKGSSSKTPSECTLEELIETLQILSKELPRILQEKAGNPERLKKAEKQLKELKDIIALANKSIAKSLELLQGSCEENEKVRENVKKLAKLLGKETRINVGKTSLEIKENLITTTGVFGYVLYNGIVSPTPVARDVLTNLPKHIENAVKTTKEVANSVEEAVHKLEQEMNKIRATLKKAVNTILEVSGVEEIYLGHDIIIERDTGVVHIVKRLLDGILPRDIAGEHPKYDIISVDIDTASLHELEILGKKLAEELKQVTKEVSRRSNEDFDDLWVLQKVIDRGYIELSQKNPKVKITEYLLRNDGLHEVTIIIWVAKGKYPRIAAKIADDNDKENIILLKPTKVEHNKVIFGAGDFEATIHLSSEIAEKYRKTKEYNMLKFVWERL